MNRVPISINRAGRCPHACTFDHHASVTLHGHAGAESECALHVRRGAEAQRVRDAQAAASPNTFLTQELRHAEERAEAASQGARDARAQQAQQAAQLKACRKRLRAVQADLQVCRLAMLM